MRNQVIKGLAAILALTLLAGCGGSKSTTPNAGSAPAEKVIRFNAGSDFRSLDPGLITDAVSGYASVQQFEGLVRVNEKGTVPGMAEKWEISQDGTKYTFHLRDGLKWSNGDPITAEDFVYAWTRVLDPKFGSEYAYQLYYLKGGEAFNTGKGTAADLGVKALDPKTLEVTLVAPTPYFLNLTAFTTLMPVDKKAVEANKDWAAKAETLVSNGPFMLKSWAPKEKAVLVKNPNYWNAAAIKVDRIEMLMVEELATSLQLFESGQADLVLSPPPAEVARLQKEGKLKFAPLFQSYYYTFNTAKKPFDDPKVRRALALALDRKAITTNVTKLNQAPAFADVPPGAPDATPGSDFRQVGGDYFKEDLAEAKKLLAEAGYPDGKGFPVVELSYNTSEAHKAIAEAAIEMWKQNLGITSIKAANMEFKVLLDNRQKGDFAISRAGWYGDYTDAMTFLDMWTTTSQNTARYNNPAYDALIKTAKTSGDQQVRQEAMHKAEALLMADMPILPVYYGNNPYLQADKLTGVYLSPLGSIDFTNADVK
ncbi:MAG TPA: peptide ABC transporter substrate-binding protein [Symbiobacteriaceae bacterium]|nr:peptide ABC transporter substrate-binding protein [Symbiobacteriaceae bacterium]